MMCGVESMTCAVGCSGTGEEVVVFGVGDGSLALEGQDGESGMGEGGFAAAMTQKGQFGL